jgi:threonine/homoserine/homoserine lactone efflux protein
VLLGAILVGTGLAFDLVLASAGAGLGRALVRHPRWQALQRRLFAALLIGFGLRLAAD